MGSEMRSQSNKKGKWPTKTFAWGERRGDATNPPKRRRGGLAMKEATLRQGAKILSLFEETPNEQVQAIVESGLLADLRDGNISLVNRDDFRRMLDLPPLKPQFPTYKLTVNYDRTVADGIAAGKYDWANDNITQQNFPSKRSGMAEVNVQLVPFGRVMTTDEVTRELDKLDLRSAELPELLALGGKHPDLQKEGPIVALSSRWQDSYGHWFVPYLRRHDAGRALDLHWTVSQWNVIFRFAAVSKSA